MWTPSIQAVRVRPGGLGVLVAATFIAAERAGTGLLALPHAVGEAGILLTFDKKNFPLGHRNFV